MTHEEMGQTLGRLAELQLANQQLLRETLGAMGKLSGLVVSFAADTKARMDGLVAVAEDTHERINGLVAVVERLAGVTERTENAVASLAALIEAFIRGSHNGGKQA